MNGMMVMMAKAAWPGVVLETGGPGHQEQFVGEGADCPARRGQGQDQVELVPSLPECEDSNGDDRWEGQWQDDVANPGVQARPVDVRGLLQLPGYLLEEANEKPNRQWKHSGGEGDDQGE